MTAARGITLLRVYLGALFCTVFFENIAFNRYTADGYQSLIDRYAERNDAPGFWSDGVMDFFADQSEVFAPLQFVTELSFAVLLVLGIATGVVALVASGFLLSLWLSELGIFWIWELLSISAIALVVAITTLPALREAGPLRARILGPSTFGGIPMGARLGLAVAGGLVLAGAILAAGTGGGENSAVAWRSGALFGALLVACAALDRLREDRPSGATTPPPRASATRSRATAPPGPR
jgi:uncharacterized membrane protein YphA (DoxX/SURF4 family)